MCRYLYWGMGIGDWASCEPSPYNHDSSNHNPTDRQLGLCCRNLYGGMGVGEWQSLEESPYDHASSNYDPIFWFLAVNASGVAIHVESLSQLPKILNELPNEELQRMQSAMAEAQPLLRYRSVSDDTLSAHYHYPANSPEQSMYVTSNWRLQTFLRWLESRLLG